MSVSRDFCHAVRKELALFVPWPPGEPIHVGDYGRVDGCRFNRTSNVSTLQNWPANIGLDARPPRAVSTPIWSSESATTLEVGAGYKPNASAPVLVSGGLRFEFEKKDSFAINLGDAKIHALVNTEAVMWELHRRAHLDDRSNEYWDHKRLRVVTKVVACRRYAFAMASQSNAAISLELAVNGGGAADIGSAGAEMKWSQRLRSVATWEGRADDGAELGAMVQLMNVFREPFSSGIELSDC